MHKSEPAGNGALMPAATMRSARPGEAAPLSALALRSKAHWGYESDFLEACRSELSISEALIREGRVFVLEGGFGPIGFYTLTPFRSDIELGHFFVDPPHIGRGAGRLLWRDAVARARALGYDQLLIQSDPNAEGFYLRLGAQRIGEVPSAVQAGRALPLLLLPLREGEYDGNAATADRRRTRR
jgi:GNAT superfamily N-acetyltransferase